MYSYVKALEKAIYDLGGEIYTNSPVDEILIKNNKAIGIISKDKEIYGDIVISNADFPYTMDELIKNPSHKGKYKKEKLNEMKYTCSTFILYLGLKKKYPELNVHNIYINDNFKENIEYAFTGKLPSKPSFYIYSPTQIDQSMAKNNGECISVVVRVPNLLFDNITWNKDTIKTMRDRIITKYDISSRTKTKLTDDIISKINELIDQNEKNRLLGRSKQLMKKIDIHEKLLEIGFDISYPTVCNYIRENHEKKEAFIRQEYNLGETLEFDWGEVPQQLLLYF